MALVPRWFFRWKIWGLVLVSFIVGVIREYTAMCEKVLIILVLGAIVLVACMGYLGTSGDKIVQKDAGSECINGSGRPVRQVVSVESFSGVVVDGPVSILHVDQDGTNGLAIEAQENIISVLETSVDADGILHIGYSRCIDDSGLASLLTKVVYFVSMDQVSQLSMNGSGKIINEKNTITSDELKVTLSGSGKVKLDLDVAYLTSISSGSGTIELKGKAKEHNLTLSGSGKTRADKLITEKTKATISGSGSARVYVTDTLISKVAGSGNIKYKGEPKDLIQN